MREVAALMRLGGGGSIIDFSSIWGNAGIGKAASYHASKGAVRTLSKHAAVLLAPDKIRVNTVHPGFIDTRLTRAQDPAVNAEVIHATPLRRGGEWREGRGGTFPVEDPATRLAIATVANGDRADARAEIAYAAEFMRWYAEEAVRTDATTAPLQPERHGPWSPGTPSVSPPSWSSRRPST